MVLCYFAAIKIKYLFALLIRINLSLRSCVLATVICVVASVCDKYGVLETAAGGADTTVIG